ncbi:unnamed protein product [Brassica rapa subsp. narinosa]
MAVDYHNTKSQIISQSLSASSYSFLTNLLNIFISLSFSSPNILLRLFLFHLFNV